MKNSHMTVLGLIAVLTMSATSHALSLKPAQMQVAALNQFLFQEGSYLSLQKVASANVTIDPRDNMLTVTIYRKFYCPPQVFCTQMMPAPVIYQAKLQSVETGGCGEVIYKGVQNRMIVDGGNTEIEIHDNTQLICRIFLPDTEVTLKTAYYNRIDGHIVEESHYLNGTALTAFDVQY